MVMFIEPTLFILAKQSSRYFIGSVCGLGQALQTSILWLEGINLCTNKNIARSASIAVPALPTTKLVKTMIRYARTPHSHTFTHFFVPKWETSVAKHAIKWKWSMTSKIFVDFFFMRTGASFPYLHKYILWDTVFRSLKLCCVSLRNIDRSFVALRLFFSYSFDYIPFLLAIKSWTLGCTRINLSCVLKHVFFFSYDFWNSRVMRFEFK